MDKNKIRDLITTSKNLSSELLNTHDTHSEKLIKKNKVKRLLDTTNPSKTYVICIFEIN